MRIAIDSRYVRARPSGIGAYLEALIARIPWLAPEIQFLLWAHAERRQPLSAAANVDSVVVRPEPSSLWTLMWPDRFGPLAGVDLFHAAHNLLPRGLAMPTVVTIHDLLALELPRLHRSGWDAAVKRWYYPAGVWRALRRGTRLVTTTAAMADRVAALCPAARPRTVVIPMACDASFRPSTGADHLNAGLRRLLGSAEPYFLVVGQHSPTKRHADAVRAFAAAAPPGWRLVLLQRQTAINPLNRLIQSLHLGERVIWLPRLPPEDLVLLLQGAAALVQPSLYEGFGLPVVEAMACGCPVIASDLATLREVLGGAAVHVPVGDVGALAAAMARLAASADLRAQLSGRGLERAASFSWDRCAHDTLALYRDAAAAGAAPPIR